MTKRTPENYESQKQHALAFGRNPPEAAKFGLNSKGALDKVLFGTCDTCDLYFAENIMPVPGMDVDGEKSDCGVKGCKGTVTQVHLEVAHITGGV
jgi:hypothetical protein